MENFKYCQSQIESDDKCEKQCDHCKMYYAPLEYNFSKVERQSISIAAELKILPTTYEIWTILDEETDNIKRHGAT